jgi:hypothetical protein
MPASADSSQKLNHDAIAMASFFQRTASSLLQPCRKRRRFSRRAIVGSLNKSFSLSRKQLIISVAPAAVVGMVVTIVFNVT